MQVLLSSLLKFVPYLKYFDHLNLQHRSKQHATENLHNGLKTLNFTHLQLNQITINVEKRALYSFLIFKFNHSKTQYLNTNNFYSH